MNKSFFHVVPLDSKHDRTEFNSGSLDLDRYFREQVTQDVRRRVSACFVALNEQNIVAGYYTLASASMMLSDLPIEIKKKLPRYPTVPVVRMGRLAVTQGFRGKGLGGALLVNALYRAAHSEIAAYALLVDSKDESAKNFYIHHGFIPLSESHRTFFLPLSNFLKQKKI